MSSLAGISQELLGRDPRRANAPIQLQVDRYKDEWLYWEMHYMDPVEFMREVFWKIDDAIINIYPVGWVGPLEKFLLVLTELKACRIRDGLSKRLNEKDCRQGSKIHRTRLGLQS